MNVSFQEAAKQGYQGRIVWAIATLGRTPQAADVFMRAKDPAAAFLQGDTLEQFLLTVETLVAQGIVQRVPPDRLRLSLNNPEGQFAARCSICKGRGPYCEGKDAAQKAAEDLGFLFYTSESEQFNCLCPQHRKQYEKIQPRSQGQSKGKPKNRRMR